MRSGMLEIVPHRFDLFVGLVGLVEFDVEIGEELHYAGSLSSSCKSGASSPTNLVLSGNAFMPFSFSHRTTSSAKPWVTNTVSASVAAIAVCSSGQSA